MKSKIYNKNPSQFNYIAYLRVEVKNLVLYYHFYNNNGRIYKKTPHVEEFDVFTTESTIRKFVKYETLDSELIQKLESKIEKLIEELEETHNCVFKIIEE
ncbi:hypothetical protein [Methanobrevibacter sp.]